MKNQFGMPLMGFGTYGRNGDAGIAAILTALEAGYRHLDTAQSYDTERETGTALMKSGLARSDVFVTTKIDTANFDKGLLIPSLEKSLDAIGVAQVDLTLIHWPSPNGKLPLAVYIEQLVEAQGRGLTRLIGVSNFTIALLDETERLIGPGRIANNQFELNPYLTNAKLAVHCKAKGISVTCYQPIAKGTLADDPVLKAIAAKHDATVEQIALAWEFAHGHCAIPTSSKPERIRSNFKATMLALSDEEITQIDRLDRGRRAIDPEWGPAWD